MEFLKRLLLSSCVFLAFGCLQGEPSKVEKEATKPLQVFVLCDVSSSVDTGEQSKDRLQEMAKSCSLLLRSYPPNTFISFQIISGNTIREPFDTLTLSRILKRTKRRQLQELIQHDSIILHHILAGSKEAEATNRTCILSSIESAYHRIIRATIDRPNYFGGSVLHIFSDMIEYCDQSPMGSIKMSNSKDQIQITKEDLKKVTNHNTGINFDSANIKVKIKPFSPGWTSQDKQQLLSIWRKIFEKYNYHEPGELF